MSETVENVAAVILAGGFGTRVQHLLPTVPKPMAPVAGRPFIEHIVRYLLAAEVKPIVVSTGYLSEVVASHFRSPAAANLRVQCVPETEPLGTAGGFVNARAQSGIRSETWLVTNGDSLVLCGIREFLQRFRQSGADAGIVGLYTTDASRFGTLESDRRNRLVRFAEKRAGAGVVNAGIYAFSESALVQFPSTTPLSFETEVFPTLLRKRVHVYVHRVEAPFLDIGSPEALAQAERFIRTNYVSLNSPIV